MSAVKKASALVVLAVLALSGCDLTDLDNPRWVEPAEPTATPDEDVKYLSCFDVRQAGKAPLHRGDPGFASRLDGDGDGVACDGR